MKKALIIGITGQDGSYLAELLLSKNYEVHGLIRRSSSINTGRIDHIYKDRHEENVKLFLHYGDLSDGNNMNHLIKNILPDEIYNLGAMSHVAVSFETPEYTANIDGLGTLRILEAIRLFGLEKKTKFYQASTSELYGKVQQIPQTELTPFYPRSPYAVAKLYAYWIVKNYREAYGMFAVNGILFNHEGPRRGINFVTRKITRAVSAIHHDIQNVLYLGNIDSQRDWGHAKDYVEGMWRMLQADVPEDFLLATNETHTVRKFVELSFKEIGITIEWKGKRGTVDEIGVDSTNHDKILVKIDPKYFRPTEVDILIGDYSKAKEKLGWEPTIKLEQLISEMMKNDLNILNPKN